MAKPPIKIADNISDTKGLIDAVSFQLKNEGADESIYDFGKASEVKMAMFETKSNELVHTTNSGYGLELMPGTVQMTDFLDLAPTMSDILPQFKGYHGRNLDKVASVSCIGELGLHNVEAESTDDTLTAVNASSGKLPTDKVTITQKKAVFRVTITDEMVRFVNIVDVVALMQRKLAESSARTTVNAIINGDTVLTANTNINLIDGTPAGTEPYMIGNGLRKAAFSESTASDGGTLAFADFLTLMNAVGENVSGDMMWLFGTYSHNLALAIDEFKNQYVNGAGSTVISGKVPSFLGHDVFTNRYLTKANTVGKISATPGNNTKGQILFLDKYAAQWGYNGEYSIELVRIPAKGWQLVGYYYVGVEVANGEATTDKRVASLYNLS